MNAFTSSDWTAYPFASQNKKDFNNLLDVYLDAVFFSRLHELDFAQEGHRIEFSNADDPSSDLVFKGVVFNEMKGAMSPPVSVLWQTLTKHLFPATTYHYNSGGDPECIPDLSYQGLKDFYKTHYHPSNAVFMTYGDIPAYEHQERFEEQVLKRFERLDIHIAVPDEQRYHAPVIIQESYALDPSEPVEDKTHIVLGWLLGRSTELLEQLEAHLLDGVLLDDSASPLRHALETSDLGTAPSPMCGLESSNREMSFMCGVEGSRPEHAEAVQELILSVLQDVAENGVPLERLQAVLHQLELGQREVSGDGYPYGLHLILEGLSAATHHGDPFALMNIDPVLETLRKNNEDPGYIKRLVTDRLLSNQHRIRLTLVPDTGLAERRDQAEARRLEAIKSSLSDAQQQAVIKLAADLEARQQQEDDPEVLPKVTLEDVPAEMHIAQGATTDNDKLKVSVYDQGTNGLVYEQVVIELPQLEDELLEVLPYYTRCLPQLGSGGRDYLETQALQSSVTGGLSLSSSIRSRMDDVQSLSGHLVFSSKALVRNYQAMSVLLRETLEQPRFDELGRIRELIAQQRARSEQSVTGNGHGLAMTAASSGLSAGAALQHRLGGLAGIQFLKSLDDGLAQPAAIEKLAEKFQRIHKLVLSAPRQFLLVGEEEYRQNHLNELINLWKEVVQPDKVNAFAVQPVQETVKQCWITNTQVNFCSRAYPTVPVEHPDAAVLSVLAGFMRNGFLHRVIREQGGAYGGGASHDADNAAFRFYSYRDPRLSETLDDFDQSVKWLLESKHEYRQVEEAILGVIGAIDKPGSPAGEAKDAFYSGLYGRTPEKRRQFRQRVLAVTMDDLKRVGETYLRAENASTAVITNGARQKICEQLGLKIYQL
jgi:Zn-dependent M16 (insulinase) family peptidase